MAKHELVSLNDNEWLEITANDTDDITAVHRGGGEVLLQFGGTGGGGEPDPGDFRGLPVSTSKTGMANGFLKKTLTEMTYVATPKRVYARCERGKALLEVEHG